jgi:hypothetical protein
MTDTILAENKNGIEIPLTPKSQNAPHVSQSTN